MRILLIEDNVRLSELVSHALTTDGFLVDVANTLADANELLSLNVYDLILLDLSLPDGDGLSVIKSQIASKKSVPIMVMTARGGLDDRVIGLNLGADDYLVKPFATEELIARCRALLRRPGGALGSILTAANLSFNTSQREASINGKHVSLSPREMALLEHLLRKVGQIVTRQSLESSLYSMDNEVTPNALEASVSRLRRWLKSSGVEVSLHTSHGVGYALIPEAKSHP